MSFKKQVRIYERIAALDVEIKKSIEISEPLKVGKPKSFTIGFAFTFNVEVKEQEHIKEEHGGKSESKPFKITIWKSFRKYIAHIYCSQRIPQPFDFTIQELVTFTFGKSEP